MKQRGFTLIELLALLSVVATIAFAAGVVYILIHFVGKFW